MRRICLIVSVCLALALPACGGSKSPTSPDNPTTVTVTVNPANASAELGATLQFTATVTGSDETGVTWSVDGGAAFGTITAAGLYTAPATLPAPATATVRATSTADAARSGAGQVTLSAPPPPAVPLAAIQQTFNSGTEIPQTADALVNGAAEVVFAASIANGGSLTLTGTVTEDASSAQGFTWSPAPADRMIVNFASGQSAEIVFAAFEGFLGGEAADFVDFHANLDFTVTIEGLLALHVRSASGNPAAPKRATLSPAGVTAFQRTLQGTVVSDGETLTVDLTHAGQRTSDIGGSSIDYLSEEASGGTISSPSGQIAISAGYRYHLVRVDNFVENVTRTVESEAAVGDDTWRFTNVTVRKAYFNNLVSEPDFWLAGGSLLKNGAPVGAVRFNGPVVDGGAFPGPAAEVALTTGEVVPLAPSALGAVAKALRRDR